MSNAWRNHKDEAEDHFDGRPSKSERKREMHALQDIGTELVELPAERLKKLDLPEDLRAAVLDARRFTKHEARRRQMQYIGKLMRGIDAEPIRAALDAFRNVSKEEIARHHRLERLRDDFLTDEKVAGRIVELWPAADLQHLRTLRRNALKEREQNKPPRAYREIFRILRDLDGAPVRDDEEPDETETA
jgi:ribosome-associated protein